MFIENALKVKNNLWRYALGLFIIFIFTQLGFIPFIYSVVQKVGFEAAAISFSNPSKELFVAAAVSPCQIQNSVFCATSDAT